MKIHDTNDMTAELVRLILDQSAWSQATFGRDEVRGPVGPLKHLAKEAIEAAESPTDLEEYADCFLLMLDATRRGGFSFVELLSAAIEKLAKNRLRTWPTPTSATEPVEHVD